MKRAKAFFAAFLLVASSLFVLAAPTAFAATKTWTGGGADNNMTTGGNWGGSAPNAGDDLIFPAGITDRTVVNDFTAGTSFNSVKFTGAASDASDYSLSGNEVTVVAGVSNEMTGSTSNNYQSISAPLTLNGAQTIQTDVGDLSFSGTVNVGSNAITIDAPTGSFLSFSGAISGSGNITKTGAGFLALYGNSTSYSGNITASAGRLSVGHNYGLGTTAGTTTIADGADIAFGNCEAMTIGENITLTGSSSDAEDFGKLTGGSGCSGAAVDEVYGVAGVEGDITLEGVITLGSNITMAPVAKKTTLTGDIDGDYAISLSPFAGYGGQLIMNSSSNESKTKNGTYSAPVLEKTLSDNEPTKTVMITGNTVITLDGTRGDVSVDSGATLKGTGTAAHLGVLAGGTVAPGHSPGCLTSSGLLLKGTLSAELGGTTACTGYDQLKVNGTVDVTGGALSVSLYNSFKPKVGQKYVLISNDGTDAVTGTFTGVAEGGTVTAGGASFKVSYKGGDGNDVELTVLVAAPNTGFALIKANPLVSAGAVIIAAFGLLYIARRTTKTFSRR